MQVTGKNLDLLIFGLECGVSDLRGQVGSCPDVVAYADDLEELDSQIEELTKFLNRALAAREREG